MKHYLAVLFFLMLLHLGDASAQNLALLVEKQTREPVTTNVPVNIEQIIKLPPARVELVRLQEHFFKSLHNTPRGVLERLAKITKEPDYHCWSLKVPDQSANPKFDQMVIKIKEMSKPTFFNGRLAFGFRRQGFSPIRLITRGKGWR
jgi:hypothetical protein